MAENKKKPYGALQGLNPSELVAGGISQEEPEVDPEKPELRGYRIGKLLGRGGMGKVWEAVQINLEREVAVKVLVPPTNLIDIDALQERLKREAQTMGKLRHPNIVAVIDFQALDDESSAIVMEKVDGVSLREKLAAEREVLPFEKTQSWGLQILSAIAAAHESGAIHRDIKPENVLISREDDAVRLVDFGLALPMDQTLTKYTLGTTSAGTLGYMAPEQLDGGEVTEKADIFSFGVMFYEMLTGVRPQGLIRHPSQIRRGIGRRVGYAVMRCLEQDPEKRNITLAELEGALRNPSGTRRMWLTGAAGIFATAFGGWGYELFRHRWRDVLSQIDPETAAFGSVEPFEMISGGRLESDTKLAGAYLPIPDEVSEGEYDFLIQFRLIVGDGHISIIFSAPQGTAAFDMALDKQGAASVYSIDGQDTYDNGGAEQIVWPVNDGEDVEVLIRLRRDSIKIFDGEGKERADYPISGSHLTLRKSWGEETSFLENKFAFVSAYRATRLQRIAWRPAPLFEMDEGSKLAIVSVQDNADSR